jgi:hypothetical protein
VDFTLDPVVVQAAHDERVRRAERVYLVREALASSNRPAKGANWLLRGWRRWRGQLAEAAATRRAPGGRQGGGEAGKKSPFPHLPRLPASPLPPSSSPPPPRP